MEMSDNSTQSQNVYEQHTIKITLIHCLIYVVGVGEGCAVSNLARPTFHNLSHSQQSSNICIERTKLFVTVILRGSCDL